MKESVKIGTLFGIPIELHILFILLMVFVFAISLISGRLDIFVYLSLLFFTVVLHEFSHSLVAMSRNIKIEKITLFPIGGVSAMEKMPEDPKEEFMISIAGPGLNFLFAALTYLIIALIPGGSSRIFPFFDFRLFSFLDLLVLFFKVNVLLGAFNLFIPALPMDGGRVLRALLAMKIGFNAATDIAAGLAKLIAIMMFLFGMFFNWWLLVISFFVYVGASQELESMEISALLKGIKVKDVMSSKVIYVSEDMSLEEFSDIILEHRHMGYPVIKDGSLIGIITFTDLARIPKTKWREIKVGDVMSKDVVTVSPEDNTIDVLTKMMKLGIGRVPVVKDGQVVGIVSRTDIVRTAQVLKLRR
jgi:Zn-dependent protease